MRILTCVTLIFLVISCKAPETLMNYGVLDTRYVCRNDAFKDSNLILVIESYEFQFAFDQFEQKFVELNDGQYLDELNQIKKHYSSGKADLKIVQAGNVYIIKKTDTIYPIFSFGINLAFDELLKSGQFYLKSQKGDECVNYRSWVPNYQGDIYSEWIISKKRVKYIYFGSVD